MARITRFILLTSITDLTPLNVRFMIPGIENISEVSLLDMLAPVRSHTIRRADGKPLSRHIPRCVTETASFEDFDFCSLKEVVITSFGRAFSEYKPRSTLQRRPTAMVSPELLFGYPASSESDIWQLACLLFLVHTQKLPFRLNRGYDHFLWELTTFLGPIPDSWAGKYQWSEYTIAMPPGTLRNCGLAEWFNKAQPTDSLEDHMRGTTPERAQEIAPLLHKMLVWEPEKRLKSSELYNKWRPSAWLF